MNIKTTLILLTSILSTSASAQVVRGTAVAIPMILPGPIANIPALELPSITVIPSAPMALAPVLSAPAFPVNPIVPVTPVVPARVLPIMPVMPVAAAPGQRIMPIMPVTQPHQISRSALRSYFVAAAKEATENVAVVTPKRLDNLFDGSEAEKKDESGPVRSDRHHSLPENDLEKEIGAY